KKTGTRRRPQGRIVCSIPGGMLPSARVIHFVFDGVGGVLEADDLGHFEVDVGVDEVVVEHAAGGEEAAAFVEAGERLAQRAAHGGDLLQLGGRQVVEVFVDGGAGVELVLDAVEAGHQHGGEAE